jgi:pimeloyl-ACP methyl ester carboxylesterase
VVVSAKPDSFCRINKSKIFYKIGGKGTPVVFIAGVGEDHSTWDMVTSQLKGHSLTLSYDRCGLGKSGYHGEAKDLLAMAMELESLVKKIHFPDKFIIAGHSLGCQIAKKYVSLYPGKIIGIIFIDPGYDEDNLKKIVPDLLWEKRQATLKKYLPPFTLAQTQELKNLNEDCRLADSIKRIPRVPVILFTGTLVTDFPASSEEIKVKMQTHNQWLKTMPWASHVIVPESRHYIQNDKPELIVNEINKISHK